MTQKTWKKNEEKRTKTKNQVTEKKHERKTENRNVEEML